MNEKNTEADVLDILVSMDDLRADGDKGIFSRAASPVVAPVSITALRENFLETLESLKRIFSELPDISADLPLQQVQLTFEITATGKVALIGTSAEVAGKGAIAVTFARRHVG